MGRINKLGGEGGSGKQYQDIGVYRKVADEMAMARVRAFLKVIQSRETHGHSDTDAWYALYSPTGKQLKAGSIATHPSDKNKDEPAGAYQIRYKTWVRIVQEFTGWPKTFNPQDQERTALYILQAEKDNENKLRSSLGYIMEGNIEDAITKTKLRRQWSSLPGGSETRGYTMDQFKLDYEKYLKEFVK